MLGQAVSPQTNNINLRPEHTCLSIITDVVCPNRLLVLSGERQQIICRMCVPYASHSAAVQIKECGAVGFGACLPAIPAVSVLRALFSPLATTRMGS
jgi:hypothetical protein